MPPTQDVSMEAVMKRVIIAGAIVLASALNAHAGQMVYKWYDTIRTNGHKRPDPVGYANLAKCNAQFGEQTDGLSPEFKACMQSLGYRLLSANARYSCLKHNGNLQQGLA
jgi:hypothetical protein